MGWTELNIAKYTVPNIHGLSTHRGLSVGKYSKDTLSPRTLSPRTSMDRPPMGGCMWKSIPRIHCRPEHPWIVHPWGLSVEEYAVAPNIHGSSTHGGGGGGLSVKEKYSLSPGTSMDHSPMVWKSFFLF